MTWTDEAFVSKMANCFLLFKSYGFLCFYFAAKICRILFPLLVCLWFLIWTFFLFYELYKDMDSVTDVFSNHAFLFYLYSSIIVWFRLCSQGKPIFLFICWWGEGKMGRKRERESFVSNIWLLKQFSAVEHVTKLYYLHHYSRNK